MIIRIAISCAIIGLILLAFYEENSKCIAKGIGEINKQITGSKVSVFGRIVSIQYGKDSIKMTVFDGNYIDAILFNTSEQNLISIQKDDFLSICGTVSEYKNKLEIIIEGIKVV